MSKLLLIIALAVFSFARSRPVVKKADAVSLYYDNQIIGTDGKVIIDTSKYVDNTDFTGKIAIDTLKPLDGVTKTDVEAFQLFNETKFGELKTTITPSQAERNCQVVEDSFDETTYLLYGYDAFVVGSKDYAPSITGLVANSPIKIGQEDFVKSCEYPIDYLSYALYAEGFVGTDCIPNTVIPASGKECVTSATPYAATLKGYREGYFFQLTAAAVKDLILRLGAVLIQTDGGDELYIGWKKDTDDFWVQVTQEAGANVIRTKKITDAKLDGIVLFDVTKAYNCEGLTEETAADVCPCPTDKESPEYEADPRTGKKGICAAGTMRAAWAVVVAVLAVPALSLFW